MKHNYILPMGLALAAALGGSLRAADFIADGVAYNILDPEKATVEVAALDGEEAGGLVYKSKVEVPATVLFNDKEYQVVAVGDTAFKNCLMLSEVKLPPTIERIGEQSFANCRWMSKCDIPQSVTHIGSSAFFYCSLLHKADLPENLTQLSDYSL